MSARLRLGLFLVGGVVVAAGLLWGMAGLSGFGAADTRYGRYLNDHGVHQRHAPNVVNAVVLDYRGFDTLGEEFILFASVMGVTLLLRLQREEAEGSPHDQAEGRMTMDTSDAVRVASLALIAPSMILGLYTVVHGHLSPGGGFQGGVVLAAGPVLLYLAGRYLMLRTVHPMHALDLAEGTGAGGFVVVGLVGLIVGTAFLANVFGLGQTGSVFAAGSLPVLNVSVGVEVAAGVTLVIYEFLEQTLMIRPS
ncbi:MAG TPA: hydrogen gas-evolving membrane-bound hydrogenase subunit E [Actinomycetota bacterium]